MPEVVHPLLHGHEARSCQRTVRDKRCGNRVVIDGVLGTVFVSCQVEAELGVAVFEPIDDLLNLERIAERIDEFDAAIDDLALVGSPQPAPEGTLGRRNLDARTGQRRKYP